MIFMFLSNYFTHQATSSVSELQFFIPLPLTYWNCWHRSPRSVCRCFPTAESSILGKEGEAEGSVSKRKSG